LIDRSRGRLGWVGTRKGGKGKETNEGKLEITRVLGVVGSSLDRDVVQEGKGVLVLGELDEESSYEAIRRRDL
jgi:hypothetical protein